MSALRDFATNLGFRDVRTILQSGNLIFERREARREGFGKSPGKQSENSAPTRHGFLRSLSEGLEDPG